VKALPRTECQERDDPRIIKIVSESFPAVVRVARAGIKFNRKQKGGERNAVDNCCNIVSYVASGDGE
jgi:hypothetical protein